MKNRKTILLAFSFIAVLILATIPFLSACSSSPSTSVTTSVPQAQPTAKTTASANAGQAPVSVKEWDVPMISVLTGAMSGQGVMAAWATQYAASEINAAGGIRGVPIKITVNDSAMSATQAVAIASNVIPGSLVLLGPVDSSSNAAVAQLVTTNKILDFGMSNEPALRDPLAPYGVSGTQDLVENTVTAAVQWLQLNPSIKKVAVLYDSSRPLPFASLVPPGLSKIGVTTDLISISFTQLDFTPQVTQAINNGDQGFLDANLPAGHIATAQALFNRGITQGTELYGAISADDPSLFTAGKGYLENSYIQENGNPLSTSPAYVKLAAAFAAQNKGASPFPLSATVGYYDAVYAFKYAVEALGLTGDPALLSQERDKLASYLYNSPSFDGLQGTFKYVKGQFVSPVYLLQIKNNTFVYVSTIQPPSP